MIPWPQPLFRGCGFSYHCRIIFIFFIVFLPNMCYNNNDDAVGIQRIVDASYITERRAENEKQKNKLYAYVSKLGEVCTDTSYDPVIFAFARAYGLYR